MAFFQKGQSMVLVKNDDLYSKQAFLKNENVGVKMHKIGIFPKGFVHDFGQKVEVFSSFLLIKNTSRKSVS